MLTNNYDALWAVQPVNYADDWEISIGRWAWPYLDRLRFGFAGDPFQSYLSIFILSIGTVAIFDTLRMTDRKSAYVLSAMVICSTTTCCFLSYRYMSPTFALSFTLSILAVPCLQEDRFSHRGHGIRIAFASLLLVVMMGLYQANLGCTFVLFIIGLMLQCKDSETSAKELVLSGFRFILTILISCIVYRLIWLLDLYLHGITIAEYRGANDISVLYILIQLPKSAFLSFRSFLSYYTDNILRYNAFQGTGIFIVITVACLLLLVITWGAMIRHDTKKGILFLILLLCLPIAVNVYQLLAPDYGTPEMQMTAPFTILVPALFCVILRYNEHNAIHVITFLLIALILYGRCYQTAFDLVVMKEGTDSVNSLVSNVMYRVSAKEEYHEHIPIMFVGSPSDNPLFTKSALWDRANDYARFGQFWGGKRGIVWSYHGVLYRLGIHWDMADMEDYQTIRTMEEVLAMPLFPAEESIRMIQDTIIVRIGP